jgi:signal transduction histidine kinase
VLSTSLDYEETLQRVAQLAVPYFADWCTVDLAEGDTIRRLAIAHVDPEKVRMAQRFAQRYPEDPNSAFSVRAVIRTGSPVMMSEVPDHLLAARAKDAEHLRALRELRLSSFMIVPLRAHGNTFGALTLVAGESGRRYTAADLRLAEEVAYRAALSVDNARAYAEARRANRVKDDFLATLSHELRTPLNALLGWTHILKMPSVDEATRKRALDSIERNARAQSVLINDLLDVSRVISGKLRLEQIPVDLPSIVLAAIDAVRPAVRAREIDLNVSLGSVTREVWGDADRLQQVMWNLLSNAVKFTPPSGRIEVSVEEFASSVQITVADNGAGIDSAFLPHVFERFRQGDSSTTRLQSGLGLGLAIVRHLVDLHGGSVMVVSEGPGRGSTFVVTLPTRGAPAGSRTSHGPADDQGPCLRGIRVLAVDDDADSRELILLTVRAADGEVMAVSSAASALDAIEAFDPHVVIADLAMPGMDGFGLIRELARRMPGRMPPVIAMSAYASPTDVERSTQAGFARHLGKPADYQRLVTTIAELAGVVNS